MKSAVCPTFGLQLRRRHQSSYSFSESLSKVSIQKISSCSGVGACAGAGLGVATGAPTHLRLLIGCRLGAGVGLSTRFRFLAGDDVGAVAGASLEA